MLNFIALITAIALALIANALRWPFFRTALAVLLLPVFIIVVGQVFIFFFRKH